MLYKNYKSNSKVHTDVLDIISQQKKILFFYKKKL